MITAENCWLSV